MEHKYKTTYITKYKIKLANQKYIVPYAIEKKKF